MSGAIAAAAVVVVGGSMIAANQAKQAAKGQANAARQAAQGAMDQYQQTREDQGPWREAGGKAVSMLSGMTAEGGEMTKKFTMEDFQQDPGYAFRLQEGQKALERSASARGGLLSGGAGKALAGYGQNMASQEYSNAYNRWSADRSNRFNQLASLAGMGQTSVQATGQAGAQATQFAGQSNMSGANAVAASKIQAANTVNSAAQSSLNYWQQANMMGQQANQGSGTNGGKIPGVDF
jgi:hypothetical protein